MPPKRKRNYKRKKTSAAALARREARKVAWSMIPQKMKLNDGNLTIDDYTDPPGLLIKPYFIDANMNLNSGSDENQKRDTNHIYISRCAGIANIEIPATCVNRVEIRKICGWYKGAGTTVASGQGPQGLANFSATHVEEVFSNQLARYDSANFKIVDDKQFAVMPKQIYDLSGSDGEVGNETMVAVWNVPQIKCNFRFNRRFRYADGKQGNADETAASGEDLVGWKPFIYIRAKAPGQNWSGSNELVIKYKFTTYFKDLQ